MGMGSITRRLLLAADPNHKIVHGTLKGMAVASMGLMANSVRDLYLDKKENGFVQAPVAVMDDAFDELMAMDECMRAPGTDYIRDFYAHTQVIMGVVLDEDTHFLKRALMFQELMFRRRYEMAAALEANAKFFQWQAVLADALVMRDQGYRPQGSERVQAEVNANHITQEEANKHE